MMDCPRHAASPTRTCISWCGGGGNQPLNSVTKYRFFGIWQIIAAEDGEAGRLGVEVTGGSPPLAAGGKASWMAGFRAGDRSGLRINFKVG